MATRTIIRGDDYPDFYRLTFAASGGGPKSLNGTTVRTTYKTEVTDPNTDTTDATAVIKHFITIDSEGDVTDADGLDLNGGDPGDGILFEILTSAETLALDVGVEYISDVEITDEETGVTTFLYLDDPVVAIDGVTNRTSDA